MFLLFDWHFFIHLTGKKKKKRNIKIPKLVSVKRARGKTVLVTVCLEETGRLQRQVKFKNHCHVNDKTKTHSNQLNIGCTWLNPTSQNADILLSMHDKKTEVKFSIIKLNSLLFRRVNFLYKSSRLSISSNSWIPTHGAYIHLWLTLEQHDYKSV